MTRHRIAANFAAGTYGADDWRARATVRFGGGGSPSGNTTTNQTSTPWSGVQPYLLEGYQQGNNLFQNYTPQYYPSDTYAGPNGWEQAALQGTVNQATTGEPVTGAASNYNTSLLQGDYLNNPGSYFSLPNATGAAITNNPGNGLYGGIANMGLNAAANPSSVPGSSAFTPYANGSMLSAGNPYFSGLTGSIASSVVPSIEANFAGGSNASNPAMAYAAASGVGNAVAPLAYQNYAQNEQNQLTAGSDLASNFFGGLNTANSGAGGLSTNFLGGSSLENSAANTIGTNWNSGVAAMNQGLAFAPQTQTMPYVDLQNLFNAGSQEQTFAQNQTNANVDQWNYNQTLPYQTLDQFMGVLSGAPGGSTSLQQPYFDNSGANTFNEVMGGLSTAALLASVVAAM